MAWAFPTDSSAGGASSSSPGDFTVGEDLDVDGDAVIGDDLTVTGDVTINGSNVLDLALVAL